MDNFLKDCEVMFVEIDVKEKLRIVSLKLIF